MGRDLAQRVQGNAAARQNPQQPASIGQLIQQLVPEIQRALPRHMDADRMARIALTVLRTNPKLGNCTRDSFMGALLTCAQLGLEPGAGGEAYLVPYEHRRGPLAGSTECQLILGYQGLVKLFWQHPMAHFIDAQAVYEHDDFDYAYGLEPFLRHKPLLRGDRGDVIAYYAVASLTSGGKGFVVLSPEQVRELRQGREGSSGNIADPQKWMERKTVLRQLVKTLPKSPNLNRALEADEKVRTDLDEDAIDAPMREVEIPPAAAAPGAQGIITDVPPDDEQPVDEQPPPADEPPVDTRRPTQPQMNRLHAMLGNAGLGAREDGLRFMSETLGRPIATGKDLSRSDIERLYATLEQIAPATARLDEPAGSDS